MRIYADFSIKSSYVKMFAGRSKVRKINGCLILLSFLAVAWMSEIKPILKPAEVDIPTRIVNLQKWQDQAVTSKEITREEAKPVRAKLDEIKEMYNRLQSAGKLSAKDSETINRMLDECSDMLYRVKQRRQKGPN
jgi:hypothetical protein